MANLEIEILTPFGVAYSNSIQSCIVPGLLGRFQVLKDHAAMLAAVDIGMVSVEIEAQKTHLLATSGGYCEISDNKIKMIVESAEKAESIDINRALASKKRAEKRISSKESGVDIVRAKLALIRAVNRIKLAEY